MWGRSESGIRFTKVVQSISSPAADTANRHYNLFCCMLLLIPSRHTIYPVAHHNLRAQYTKRDQMPDSGLLARWKSDGRWATAWLAYFTRILRYDNEQVQLSQFLLLPFALYALQGLIRFCCCCHECITVQSKVGDRVWAKTIRKTLW